MPKRKPEILRPILAICYDFDKTLSPDNMQARGYIRSIDYEEEQFWAESNRLARDNDMDRNLAYMYMMIDKARGKVLFTRETLQKDGAKVQLFPGVESWFDRIDSYGARNGVQVEHYIISSGLKEMIEGTAIADKSKVYQMLAENRIKYFVPADYTAGAPLETLLKQIIDRTRTNEILEELHCQCKAEQERQ